MMYSAPKPKEFSIGKDDGEIGLATKLIAFKLKSHEQCEPLVTPTYSSSTYMVENCKGYQQQMQTGFIYSRLKNPNTMELEMVISELEGGAGSLAYPSGMAAISNTLLCLLRPGDHLVAPKPLYSGTLMLLRDHLQEFNIEVSYVQAGCDVSAYKLASKGNTKLWYAESPCNPMMCITDIPGLAAQATEAGVLTVVDATFASPINQRPITQGIDLVLHSCTKYMGGHSDLLGGCVTARTAQLYNKLKAWQVHTGAILSPHDAVLLLRSLRTLPVRLAAHNENAMRVAAYLQSHPKVVKVKHPGLAVHPQHKLAMATMQGFGGMLSAHMESEASALILVTSTKIFKLAVSLGGVESLIEHVSSMTHGEWACSEQERSEMGVDAGLVRLSVGLESVEDQIADLEQALSKVPDLADTENLRENC